MSRLTSEGSEKAHGEAIKVRGGFRGDPVLVAAYALDLKDVVDRLNLKLSDKKTSSRFVFYCGILTGVFIANAVDFYWHMGG